MKPNLSTSALRSQLRLLLRQAGESPNKFGNICLIRREQAIELIKQMGGEPGAFIAASKPRPVPAATSTVLDEPSDTVDGGAPSPAELLQEAMEMIAQAQAAAQQPQPQGVDRDQVAEIVREEIAAAVLPRVVQIEIVRDDKVTQVEGVQHYLFPLVLKLLSCDIPVMLCGPAGSGKTTLAHNAAKALEKSFEFNSYGPGMSESKLLGYKDAGGSYHDTALTRQVKAGGVYLADELDRADGAIVTTLNSLLANSQLSTPEGCYAKADGFTFVAGTNTAGTGADAIYTAAQEQDGSLLDRLFFMPMPYDTYLMESACGITPRQEQKVVDPAEGGICSSEKWVDAVLACMKVLEGRQMRHTISPRAAIIGCKLLKAGIGINHLIPGLITKGLPEDEAKLLEAAARAAVA
jgi:hypothetical protein